MSTLRLAVLTALLAAPGTALAQDMTADVAGPVPNLRAERNLCTEALELSCREPRKAPAEQGPQHGLLVKFSHLAGMFMGRVDAAQSGDFRFRFTLDINSPPSSTNNHIDLTNRAG